MKKTSIVSLVLILGSLIYSSAFALSVTCKGKADRLKLQYSEGEGVTGLPYFEYQRGPESRNFLVENRDLISETKTVLGSLITVTDMLGSVPGGMIEYVTLILPEINFPKVGTVRGTPKTKFKTMVVETTSRAPFGGRSLVVGAIQSSDYYAVSCTASSLLLRRSSK